MDAILIIGTVAATLTTAAFFPQVIKAHTTKQTKDLSLAMFVMLFFGLIAWIIYGITLHSLPVIAANSITLVLCVYLIYLKIQYR